MLCSLCPSTRPCSRLSLSVGPLCMNELNSMWIPRPGRVAMLLCCSQMSKGKLGGTFVLYQKNQHGLPCNLGLGTPINGISIHFSEWGKCPKGCRSCMDCWPSGIETLQSAEMRNIRFCCQSCVCPLSSEATSALFFKQVKILEALNLIGNLLISLVEVCLYK